MHFLFSKIQNERKKMYYKYINFFFRHCRHLSLRTTCTWAMHIKIASPRISLYVYAFVFIPCFFLDWPHTFFFIFSLSVPLFVIFSWASLHSVACKLKLRIIFVVVIAALMTESCDRVFGIYDYNVWICQHYTKFIKCIKCIQRQCVCWCVTLIACVTAAPD